MIFKKKEEFKVDHKLKHIAFIMDGNGRWAKNRGLPRQLGHKQGAIALEKTVKNCFEFGISIVTVYAFSTENWSRPQSEVDAIIELLKNYISKAETDEGVRYVFLGEKNVLTEELKEKMNELEKSTSHHNRILNIAFNYGGRAEIVNACNNLISQGKASITQEELTSVLYTSHCVDPDLIVRTAGEYRLSNFLLWQAAYAEFYFSEVYWPDFNKKELKKALNSFYKRKRRFGGLNKNEE